MDVIFCSFIVQGLIKCMAVCCVEKIDRAKDELVIKNEKQINNSLQQLMKQGKISDKIYQRLRSTGSQPARLYGLAKVHK